MSAEHNQEGITRRKVLKLRARVAVGAIGLQITGAAIDGPIFDSTAAALENQQQLWEQKVDFEGKAISNTPPTVLAQDKQQLEVISQAVDKAEGSFVTQHPLTFALHIGRKLTSGLGVLLVYDAVFNPEPSLFKRLGDRILFSRMGQLTGIRPQAKEISEPKPQQRKGKVELEEDKQKELERNLLLSRFKAEDRDHLHPILGVVSDLTTLDDATGTSRIEGQLNITRETLSQMDASPALLDYIGLQLTYASCMEIKPNPEKFIEPNALRALIEERMHNGNFEFTVEHAESSQVPGKTPIYAFTFKEGLPIHFKVAHVKSTEQYIKLLTSSYDTTGVLLHQGRLIPSSSNQVIM